MKGYRRQTPLWRMMMVYVTLVVVVVTLLSSGAFVIYINGVLKENAQKAFEDLSDKLALSVETLINDTELLGRSMARDTVLVSAMVQTSAGYSLSRQYDDYFQVRMILLNNLDYGQIEQLRLVFRHNAFYTRERVTLLSAYAEEARQLGLGIDRLAQEEASWDVHEGVIRFVQPVINYKYAAAPVGLVVLELSDRAIASIFANIQSLEDAHFALCLHDTPVRVYGGAAESERALRHTASLGNGWQLHMAASNVRHTVRLSQSLLTILPWVAGGCLVVLLVFAWFAKRFYREVASLAEAICGIEVMSGQHVEDAHYREFSAIVTQFNALLDTVRGMFAEAAAAQEKEKVLALQMLQSQINPHFLYNSLDVINWLSYQHGAEDVAALARNLGAFYRDALGKTSNENALADELAHVRTYLDIMRCRIEGAIRLHLQVPEACLRTMLPRLSLQPVVENALQHGILQRPDQQGRIDIAVRAEGGVMRIAVRDDGPGMAPDALARHAEKLSLWPPEEMHGLENIHHRAQLLYGKAYGIALRSQAGAYMEVVLSVPANG